MNGVRVVCVLGALTMTVFSAGSTAFADAKGEEALKAAFKKLGAAKTLTFDMATENKSPGAPAPITWKGKVAAMKPNFLSVAMTGQLAPSFYADGKDYYMPSQGGMQKVPLEAKPTELQGVWEGEVDAFFGGEKLVDKVKATYSGAEKIGEVDCDVIRVEMKEPDRAVVYAIGKEDHVIRRANITIPSAMGEQVQINTLTNVKFDVPKTAADFKYTGPAAKEDPYEAALLPVGKDAPDFNLPTPTGDKLGLSDARKGKKATLVNFWFYG